MMWWLYYIPIMSDATLRIMFCRAMQSPILIMTSCGIWYFLCINKVKFTVVAWFVWFACESSQKSDHLNFYWSKLILRECSLSVEQLISSCSMGFAIVLFLVICFYCMSKHVQGLLWIFFKGFRALLANLND